MNLQHYTLQSNQSKSSATDAYIILLQELEALQYELIAAENEAAEMLKKIDVRHKTSAANLIHYLGLRRRDARPLQMKLTAVGLSSLGRAESRVLSNLNAIMVLLQHALGRQVQQVPSSIVTAEVNGAALLKNNTNQLLGDPPAGRRTRIMVTLPAEAAHNYELIKTMLLKGMDCARINCAHDNPAAWSRMVTYVRQASRETGQQCRILMDLAGPKLRTGPIALRPGVVKWRPRRDIYGNPIAPARIWLHSEFDTSPCPGSADVCVPVKGNWLQQIAPHDMIELTDARGAKRMLRVMDQTGSGVWVECSKTAYIKSGIRLDQIRKSVTGEVQVIDSGEVGELPEKHEIIRLKRGDYLILTRERIPGQPAQLEPNGCILFPASIACSIPEIFDRVRPGERILFDDGLIGGVIRNVDTDSILIEITEARDTGEKLRADKGINLPDTPLGMSGLTASDIGHLEFVTRHADIVGGSVAKNECVYSYIFDTIDYVL